MRKPLIATACLIAACLTGCGEESNAKQFGKKLDALLDDMSRLQYASAPVESNALEYTAGTESNGVVVPGAFTPDAAYIDQAITLLPQAREIAGGGSDSQKQSANAIIGSILGDEGAYLIGAADIGFQENIVEFVKLRVRVGMLEEIMAFNNALAGDRAAIIDTLKTGKVSDTRSIEGINQLEEKVGADTAAAEEARATLAELNGKIDELNKKIEEYEALDLQLTNQANSGQGAVKFEKLENATVAGHEAALAEAEVTKLGVDVTIQEGQAELAEARKAEGQAAVDELNERVAQVEAERELVAGKLAELEQTRKDTIASLTETFNSLDANIQVLGFDRMAKAQARFIEAADALGKARIRGGEPELMSVFTLHARSLHQQALAARSYAAALTALAAKGEQVLGSGLHGAVSERAADMNKLVDEAKAAAGDLEQASMGALQSLGGADPETPEGKVMLEQAELFMTYLTSVGPGGGPVIIEEGPGDIEIDEVEEPEEPEAE